MSTAEQINDLEDLNDIRDVIRLNGLGSGALNTKNAFLEKLSQIEETENKKIFQYIVGQLLEVKQNVLLYNYINSEIGIVVVENDISRLRRLKHSVEDLNSDVRFCESIYYYKLSFKYGDYALSDRKYDLLIFEEHLCEETTYDARTKHITLYESKFYKKMFFYSKDAVYYERNDLKNHSKKILPLSFSTLRFFSAKYFFSVLFDYLSTDNPIWLEVLESYEQDEYAVPYLFSDINKFKTLNELFLSKLKRVTSIEFDCTLLKGYLFIKMLNLFENPDEDFLYSYITAETDIVFCFRDRNFGTLLMNYYSRQLEEFNYYGLLSFVNDTLRSKMKFPTFVNSQEEVDAYKKKANRMITIRNKHKGRLVVKNNAKISKLQLPEQYKIVKSKKQLVSLFVEKDIWLVDYIDLIKKGYVRVYSVEFDGDEYYFVVKSIRNRYVLMGSFGSNGKEVPKLLINYTEAVLKTK